MKKTVLIIVGLVLLFGIAGFFQFGPGMVERSMNQIDGARILQIAQPILDRIDTGFGCKFVNVGFMRESIRQCRYTAKP